MRAAGASFLEDSSIKQAARELVWGATRELYVSRGEAPLRAFTFPGPEALALPQSVESRLLQLHPANRLWVAEENRPTRQIIEQQREGRPISVVSKALDLFKTHPADWKTRPFDLIWLDGMGPLLTEEHQAIFQNGWLAKPSILAVTTNMSGRNQAKNQERLGQPYQGALPEFTYSLWFEGQYVQWLFGLAKNFGYTPNAVPRSIRYQNENWRMGRGPGRAAETMLLTVFTFKKGRLSRSAYTEE